MSVLALVRESDGRIWERLLDWRPPRWFRFWMRGASRLGDVWLWPLAMIGIATTGRRAFAVLAAAAAAAALANIVQLLAKTRIRRARPCDTVRPLHQDVVPLCWFAADRFSFPSGHALNAFAVGSVVALSFPAAAVPVIALAASIAASRVVLGLHWLSDVLVGALAGSAIGCAAFGVIVR